MMLAKNNMTSRRNPMCLGDYNFDHIAYFARKRFVEGCETVALLQQAKSEREKEEIALVCMLDVEDEVIKDLRLDCRYADECKVTNCRDRLKNLIQQDLDKRGRRKKSRG